MGLGARKIWGDTEWLWAFSYLSLKQGSSYTNEVNNIYPVEYFQGLDKI